MLEFRGGCVEGEVSPPPSKSHTHRAFFMAALAEGPSGVHGPLLSDDTRATLRAVRSMGASAEDVTGGVKITGGSLHAPVGTIDVANSGTTMRIFSGIASIFDFPVTITGDESIRKRPMGPLLDALSSMGVSCTSNNGLPPVTIKGPNRGGSVRIEGNISSQFVSSLMITAPMLERDTEIEIRNELVSAPYVRITESMMRHFGAEVTVSKNAIYVGAGGYRSKDYKVPADFSSAAFPLVAGALGGKVTVSGLDMGDPQGDKHIMDILEEAGADVSSGNGSVTVGTDRLEAADIDMGPTPDLFPVVAVLLSTAKGTSRLYGAPQLRFKESDRIVSTVKMLRALGADAEETEDGCIIRGKDALEGGTVDHLDDHRIMMSAAVASLVCKGPVYMSDTGCEAVSYPEFIDQMRTLGMNIRKY
ncbi:MAG: 3-phosphoshikimate 1-carboxyvinyltransferase [Candidatus Methanomethylophilaceae archaeon]|nr:3-phosphoshikimate 1-carboxyvinyltransferase [Candidatus Methanomethylophilaceae archaeon]